MCVSVWFFVSEGAFGEERNIRWEKYHEWNISWCLKKLQLNCPFSFFWSYHAHISPLVFPSLCLAEKVAVGEKTAKLSKGQTTENHGPQTVFGLREKSFFRFCSLFGRMKLHKRISSPEGSIFLLNHDSKMCDSICEHSTLRCGWGCGVDSFESLKRTMKYFNSFDLQKLKYFISTSGHNKCSPQIPRSSPSRRENEYEASEVEQARI